MVDLDPANDGVDDVALADPIKSIDALRNLGGKVLQSIDHERQLAMRIGGVKCNSALLIELRHAPLRCRDARLEFGFVDQTSGVAVDEPIDAALESRHLTIEAIDLLRGRRTIPHLTDAPPVLVRYTVRIFQ
jgi:hypothetical protein